MEDFFYKIRKLLLLCLNVYVKKLFLTRNELRYCIKYKCRFQSEFLEELKNQETEEWAVARRRLPRLHDWLDSWENKIRLHDNLEIDTFVGRKINEIRSAIESLQSLRGDEIADEHWTELIPILGLKIENPRDLTLGHLLACTKALKENEDRIKVRKCNFLTVKKKGAIYTSLFQYLSNFFCKRYVKVRYISRVKYMLLNLNIN